MLSVKFSFKCPNCGQTHQAHEISRRKFSTVGYTLACGSVTIRMPWAAEGA